MTMMIAAHAWPYLQSIFFFKIGFSKFSRNYLDFHIMGVYGDNNFKWLVLPEFFMFLFDQFHIYSPWVVIKVIKRNLEFLFYWFKKNTLNFLPCKVNRRFFACIFDFFSETLRPISFIFHVVLPDIGPYQVCSNHSDSALFGFLTNFLRIFQAFSMYFNRRISPLVYNGETHFFTSPKLPGLISGVKTLITTLLPLWCQLFN